MMARPVESSSPGTALDLTVMVSCYNEETSIVPTLAKLVAALSAHELTAEIIVMDDCSHDGSIAAVQRFIGETHPPRVVIRHHTNAVNRGLPWNVFEAARIGQGKYFWVVGGDDALSQDVYRTLLPAVGHADVIIPNVLTYHGRPVLRWLLSRLYVRIVNALSGYTIKYYNGSSIYLRTDVTSHAGTVRGFGYSAELIISLLDQGKSYREIDVVFSDRTAGASSAVTMGNLRDVAAFFGRLLRRRLRGRRRGASEGLDTGRADRKTADL